MIHFLKSFFSSIGKKNLPPACVEVLGELFDEEYYLENNADAAKSRLEPLDHYLEFGFGQRRQLCAESDIAKALLIASENSSNRNAVVEYQNEQDSGVSSNSRLVLPYHTKGNFFFKEISQHIADAAIEVGFDAVLMDEKEFKELRVCSGIHCFFVAPQEFFYLGKKDRLHEHAKKFMPTVTYLLAEQPQTVFFLSQLEYIFDDVHIVDMNFHVATYLRSLKIPCHYFPLGWASSLEKNKQNGFGESIENMYLPEAALSKNDNSLDDMDNRPIDVVFIGNGCKRRQRFFNEYAEPLSNFNMTVFAPDWQIPHSSGGLATLDVNDSITLCQRSKIFLNIHRDDFEYFEWHRICMRGFLSGALVLTEPVFSVPEFEAGTHYLQCTLDEMPEKMEWLLNTKDGQKTLKHVSEAGRQAYLGTSMASSVSSYLSFVQGSEK